MNPKNLLIFLLFSSVIAAPAWSQAPPRDGEDAISRILHPLPDYDPFSDRAAPTPEFFPDETEKRARQVMIDSLTDPNKDLSDAVRFFRQRDADLSKERHTVTGLTDHVLDLQLNTLRSRSDYIEAQEKALDLASSDEQRKLIQSRINHDELRQANELVRKNTTNRVGSMANRLLGSVDLIDIATGSYMSAAVDTTVSQLMALRESKMSTSERKALVLYHRYLKRYPRDPQRTEIEKLVEALERKKRAVLVDQYLQAGKKAEKEGKYTLAEFQYTQATFVNPHAEAAAKGLDELAERIQRKKEEKRQVALPPEPSSKDAQHLDFDPDFLDLLYALVLRNPSEVEAHARDLGTRYADSPLGDSAQDALAVAMEMRDRHDEAKVLLHRLVQSSNSSFHKKKAEALLASPDYNLLSQVRAAQQKHRMETIRYVLLGENFLNKNLIMSAQPLVVQGLGGLNTWGIANLIIMGNNLYQVLTAHPISDQDIIDKAVAYIRNHPHSESTTEVYNLLAKAYESRGNYDKAIAYYKLTGSASEEKIRELKETAAESLLEMAQKNPVRAAKEFYLRGILEFYPDSAAAKQAKGDLAALLKPDNRGIKVSKEFFTENPGLARGGGLGLKTSLFDGDMSNMELAEQGINILSDNEILFHFKTPWGVQSRRYPVRPEIISRFESGLRRRDYEVALHDVDTRPEGSRGGIGNLPLHLPRQTRPGASDKDGADIALVKEATGTYPGQGQVLDYELLSENEKNGGSKYRLPHFQGSVSSGGFDVTGDLPATLWGDQVSFGTNNQGQFAGLKLPIPLLQDFIPIDFLLQGSTGRISLSPQIHRYKDNDDSALYR